MTTYEYSKETKPDLEQIDQDCATAGLPGELGCRYDDGTDVLKVFFENELTAEQKTTLDGIIAAA